MKVIKAPKIAYILIIAVILFSQTTFIYAATTSDLKKQQGDIQDKIDETASEISGIKKQVSATLSQISNMVTQVNDYKDEISELESKLNELSSSIVEKEKQINEKEEAFNENQDLLNKRLIALYETGTTTYLDLLLNSDGLADFISKYYLVSKLAEYDTNLLNKIQSEKEEIENEKSKLDEQKADVEATKTNIEAKTSALNTVVTEKNKLVNNLSEEEKQLQKQLEELEEDKREIANELARIAANSKVTESVTPSTAGYISPIVGKTKANITTGYGSYSWGGKHTGVDFAVSRGTPIVAVKAGTVVISKAMKNPNGTYRSYGEYIAIDHHDGTVTLYAHGLEGSRLVQVGDTVSQGQKIMSVGTTGNSTGYHLHFEVRVSGKIVNPTNYLP
ncbi:MAG: murein hydrolase activator EnvC family protein [Candidatus Scatovivens sp.]